MTTRLRDGRTLGYREWGDPHGTPLLEFRGLPSSRSGDVVDTGFLRTRHIRRITVDRPGVGDSTFQPRRTLLDWPEDVAELADAIDIDRFAVLGTSGGGPYAVACAHRLPGRVTRVGLVSALGPPDRPGAWAGMNAGERRMMVLCMRRPRLARVLAGCAVAAERARPGTLLRGLARALPECDRSVMAQREVRASLSDSYQRAFAQGIRGQVHDWGVIAAPWGFRPQDVTVEVQLWQGDLDDRVPPHHAQYLADTIPRSTLTVLPGKGHMIAFTHIEQALSALMGDHTGAAGETGQHDR